MYYTVLVNGQALGTFGHPAVQNMHLSLSVDGKSPMVFVSAVCREGDDLYFYDWLQHDIEADDRVEFVPTAQAPVPKPLNRYRMRPVPDASGTQ